MIGDVKLAIATKGLHWRCTLEDKLKGKTYWRKEKLTQIARVVLGIMFSTVTLMAQNTDTVKAEDVSQKVQDALVAATDTGLGGLTNP